MAKPKNSATRLKDRPTQLQLLSPDEIGGELLNILSKGLYTNPLDAIREYVQNSIDANADDVTIQITGNSVFIRDNGSGMDADELLKARRFGVSDKSMKENVGFRGIGIYSGFDLCDRLILRSKKEGDDTDQILEFRFGDMRAKLDAARQDPARPVIPLANLLHVGISSRSEPTTSAIDDAFTIVQLEELSDNHIHRLSDLEQMKKYLLRNLPIKFNKDFPHATAIEKALKKYVPGYKAAKLTLQIEDKRVAVEKPNIPNLGTPRMEFIRNAKGQPIAYFWACLTEGQEKISASEESLEDFEGLVYKVKGFTIGDRSRLRSFFTRPQIYLWWTGEIYVISTDVVPTSARDDFEAGLTKEQFETCIREKMKELQQEALSEQARRRADVVVSTCESELQTIRKEIDLGGYDQFELFAQLDNIHDRLVAQKAKATENHKAVTLVKEVKKLQDKVKKVVDEPTSIAERKRQATKSITKSNAAETPDLSASITMSQPIPTIVEPTSKTLLQTIDHTGWVVEGDSREVLSIAGDAIADSMGITSETYRQLMEDIETRLTERLETR